MFATDSQSVELEPTEISKVNGLPAGVVRWPWAFSL